MKKERNIKVAVEQLKKSSFEEVFYELFNEYADRNTDKSAFALKLLTGELNGIFDDYAEAFMGKTALKITDMDTKQLISDVKITSFGVEDMSYFLKDIVDATESVSEDYSRLFAVLAAVGYNYQTKGFILPNLIYIDEMSFSTFDRNDINAVIDSVITVAGKITPKNRTDRIMIACCPDNDAVREVMDDRFFLSLGVSDLMIRIIDLQDMGHYEPAPKTTIV